MKNMWNLQLFEKIERTERIKQQLRTQIIYKGHSPSNSFQSSAELESVENRFHNVGKFFDFYFYIKETIYKK
jgi:hypothetical protein